mgnify:CR=1 FL=1
MFQKMITLVAFVALSVGVNGFAPVATFDLVNGSGSFQSALNAETDKAEIPEAVTQGPEEGQIPAAENNKKGEKTMESLANQGKVEKDDD